VAELYAHGSEIGGEVYFSQNNTQAEIWYESVEDADTNEDVKEAARICLNNLKNNLPLEQKFETSHDLYTLRKEKPSEKKPIELRTKDYYEIKNLITEFKLTKAIPPEFMTEKPEPTEEELAKFKNALSLIERTQKAGKPAIKAFDVLVSSDLGEKVREKDDVWDRAQEINATAVEWLADGVYGVCRDMALKIPAAEMERYGDGSECEGITEVKSFHSKMVDRIQKRMTRSVDPVQQMVAFECWIGVMNRCNEQGNFFGARIIYDALHSPPVEELRDSLTQLATSSKDAFDEDINPDAASEYDGVAIIDIVQAIDEVRSINMNFLTQPESEKRLVKLSVPLGKVNACQDELYNTDAPNPTATSFVKDLIYSEKTLEDVIKARESLVEQITSRKIRLLPSQIGGMKKPETSNERLMQVTEEVNKHIKNVDTISNIMGGKKVSQRNAVLAIFVDVNKRAGGGALASLVEDFEQAKFFQSTEQGGGKGSGFFSGKKTSTSVPSISASECLELLTDSGGKNLRDHLTTFLKVTMKLDLGSMTESAGVRHYEGEKEDWEVLCKRYPDLKDQGYDGFKADFNAEMDRVEREFIAPGRETLKSQGIAYVADEVALGDLKVKV